MYVYGVKPVFGNSQRFYQFKEKLKFTNYFFPNSKFIAYVFLFREEQDELERQQKELTDKIRNV